MWNKIKIEKNQIYRFFIFIIINAFGLFFAFKCNGYNERFSPGEDKLSWNETFSIMPFFLIASAIIALLFTLYFFYADKKKI